MSQPIRIGIAGFGNHALRRLLPLIEADERLRLGAVWTRSEASRTLLNERGHSNITADFQQFLAAPIDVAYVASPTGLHAEHASAVLQAGHHAWVEKPIATSLADVRRLVALAEAGGRMLGEAFMFPWHAQAAAVQQALADGSIGALRSVALTFCFPHLEPHNFRYDPALGGGAFLDHACYLVKALDCYVGGEWTMLGGCIDRDGRAVDMSGAALLRRASDGVVANLNWGFGRTYVNEIQFIGERGRLLVQSAFTKPPSRSCDLILEDDQGRLSTLPVPREDPYERMLEGFIQALGAPDSWNNIRRDILSHAERFFTLRSLMTDCH